MWSLADPGFVAREGERMTHMTDNQVHVEHHRRCKVVRTGYRWPKSMKTIRNGPADLCQRCRGVFAQGILWLFLLFPYAGNAGNNGEYDYEVV